ncbi:hypothetical protein BJ944DRAFT_275415 [Cunninghamella echinulata]|nr:hypothetical protein BJ944DRAFT_275415 [Cunninghamella echinulata]
MDKLPTEVLTLVFQFLPQKYIAVLSTICKQWQKVTCQPLFFNTINIYSIQQLKKCIEMANKKTIKNKPIGYYVERFYFYTGAQVEETTFINMIKTFPNIHSINGLSTGQVYYGIKHNHIPPLNQLEYFPYWHDEYDEQWMKLIYNNQYKIKRLELLLRWASHDSATNSPSSFTPSSAPSIIQFSSFNIANFQCKINIIKLLLFPSLTHLSIYGMDIYVDEHTMEYIFQSCPQLHSLTLRHFKIRLCEATNTMVHGSRIKPHEHLKELNIEDLCYSTSYNYLLLKFPRLESLSFNIESSYNVSDDNDNELCLFFKRVLYFRLAIFNLITGYPFLKKLKTSIANREVAIKVWPHMELLRWLQQNPTQLTHLDFPFGFIVKNKLDDIYNNGYQHGQQKICSSVNSAASSIFNINISTIFEQHNYLDYLTYLSLHEEQYYSVDSLDILYFFLQYQNNSTIVSNSIEELKLSFKTIGNIYDWLDAFPNIKLLSLHGINFITDDSDDDKLKNFVSSKANQYFKNKRKQQQQSKTSDSTNQFYKLKKIDFQGITVHFKKYGWNGFFKQCPELKTIMLTYVCDLYSTGGYDNDSTPFFNLSHLSLDFLKINLFSCFPNNKTLSSPLRLHLLSIHETSLDKQYYVWLYNFKATYKPSISPRAPFTSLNIKCKYLDHLAFF